jgi:hypothetical protein
MTEIRHCFRAVYRIVYAHNHYMVGRNVFCFMICYTCCTSIDYREMRFYACSSRFASTIQLMLYHEISIQNRRFPCSAHRRFKPFCPSFLPLSIEKVIAIPRLHRSGIDHMCMSVSTQQPTVHHVILQPVCNRSGARISYTAHRNHNEPRPLTYR